MLKFVHINLLALFAILVLVKGDNRNVYHFSSFFLSYMAEISAMMDKVSLIIGEPASY
jgi:xanthine dehydrogenase iron-sulfur cluster and FAD-binding subunit A